MNMKLSSYNIKCLVIYVIYCLCLYLIGQGNFFNDDVKDAVFQYIAIPLATYLLCPFVLKLISNWTVIRWIDNAIDYLYQSIKEPGKQHKFHIEKSTLSTNNIATEKGHWMWIISKILLWVAIISGLLILIYLIPNLGVLVAALAGYIGVKMTKNSKTDK